ncbi:hypothetical protein IWQ57_001174, partial [Coemansia nantahalensis]
IWMRWGRSGPSRRQRRSSTLASRCAGWTFSPSRRSSSTTATRWWRRRPTPRSAPTGRGRPACRLCCAPPADGRPAAAATRWPRTSAAARASRPQRAC